MEITASAIYNLKANTALFKASIHKRRNPKSMCFLLIAWDILVVFFLLFTWSLWGYSEDLLSLFIVIVILNGMHVYIHFLPNIRYKRSGSLKDAQNTYVFKDDELLVTSSSTGITGTSCIKYSSVYKVMETNEYFFVFPNKLSAFIVDKATIQGGSAEDLSRKFATVFGKQYIRCRY